MLNKGSGTDMQTGYGRGQILSKEQYCWFLSKAMFLVVVVVNHGLLQVEISKLSFHAGRLQTFAPLPNSA
jgi:hypothetical protein